LTSLTFDLTPDQEKLLKNRKNVHREKGEETLRRATEENPSPRKCDSFYNICVIYVLECPVGDIDILASAACSRRLTS